MMNITAVDMNLIWISEIGNYSLYIYTHIYIYTQTSLLICFWILQSMALPWVGMKKKTKLVNSNFICQVENE